MPKVRPEQIAGMMGRSGSIVDDITSIQTRTKSYKDPVATKADLPLTDNSDGDMRLVLEDDCIYVWDGPTGAWKDDADKITEMRTLSIPVTADGQTTFQLDIPIGVQNGIASMETVSVEVNGLAQAKDKDYTLEASNDAQPKLIITWKSTDFQLEITDQLTVIYDMLLLK